MAIVLDNITYTYGMGTPFEKTALHGISPVSYTHLYALGLKEQLIFPEIEYDQVERVTGMDIIIVTSAKTDEEARELLTQFGMPFEK